MAEGLLDDIRGMDVCLCMTMLRRSDVCEIYKYQEMQE